MSDKVSWEEEVANFVAVMKAHPKFGLMFNRKHVAHHMHIFSEWVNDEGDSEVVIEWRPVFLDERDKRPGARFMNRGRNAWRIFENPHTTGENPDERFYHHGHGCSCCSTPGWTGNGQTGNPFMNRVVHSGAANNRIKGKWL